MKRLLVPLRAISLLGIPTPISNAAKHGDRCSKLNSKTSDDLSGNQLTCIKNKSGKLVWNKSKPKIATYVLKIKLKKFNSITAFDELNRTSDQQCIDGGRGFTDLREGTKIEV